MPFTWNNVNTHVAGDVLPLADWNQAATALNSMVGTWIATGLATSTSTNPTPPFYCYFGSATNNSGSQNYVMTFPNGGFPNGVIAAFASCLVNTTNANIIISPGYGTISKTGMTWYFYTGANAAYTASQPFSFLIIGY
jgi:hypothetical protein